MNMLNKLKDLTVGSEKDRTSEVWCPRTCLLLPRGAFSNIARPMRAVCHPLQGPLPEYDMSALGETARIKVSMPRSQSPLIGCHA